VVWITQSSFGTWGWGKVDSHLEVMLTLLIQLNFSHTHVSLSVALVIKQYHYGTLGQTCAFKLSMVTTIQLIQFHLT
jgi:hypothetical protein